MLFKILRGPSTRVSKDKTEFHDGYAYFTPDDGGFYIDAEDTDTGAQNRIRVNPVMEHQDISGLLNKTGDASNTTATFTAPSARENIKTGEKLSVIMGKIAKWFSSLGTLAFKSSVAKSDLAADVQTSLGKADTVPTKVSELTNDAKYITADQAPVQSVNGKAGAVTLSATDVSAIPSTLTGTAGQVLTKTADGQEWKDVTPRDVYFDVNGMLQNQDLQILDAATLSALTSDWNQLAVSGVGDFRDVDIPMPCIDVQYNTDSDGTIILRYAGMGATEEQAIFTGIYYDAVGALQYSVSLLYQLGEQGFQEYNIIPVGNIEPSTTTPLADASTGSIGTLANYARADHIHPMNINTVLLKNTDITLPTSTSVSWSSVTYGNGKFVAISKDSTTVAYSTDGINWTKSTLPLSESWSSVTYGNGKFVAVSKGSTTAAYSPDGINWTKSTLPSDANWISITYGNGKFVATGGGISAYSTDGINWVLLAEKSNWASITYGGDRFVAVSSNDSKVGYSTDGINWTTSNTLPFQGLWCSIAYGNGKFVTLSSYNDRGAYSINGIDWHLITLPKNAHWISISYGNGKFVAITNNSNISAYSTDGITWTKSTLPSVSAWISVAYGNNKFVAISNNNNISIYSMDGINWISYIKALQYPDGTDIHEQVKEELQIKELPNITTADNGKFLRVVNGAWAAVEIANANGGSF